MDPRLLSHYNRELQYMREMGGEFAAAYPKIAGRLGLDGFECADPYVERLLEGFAFLTARVQLKLDAQFPRFTQHLLEAVYPHYLAPTPSMAVVQFHPELSEAGLADGYSVPRGSELRGLMGRHDKTACEYRTANEFKLWPLELAEASYLVSLAGSGLPDLAGARAGIRLRLRATAGLKLDALSLDRLPLYLRGADELPMRLYEQLMTQTLAVVARPAGHAPAWQVILADDPVRPLGFDQTHSLLPPGMHGFDGNRLLQEYFACPARYMFVELTGLAKALQRCPHEEIELVIVLGHSDPYWEQLLNADHFALFCTPAINLFSKQCDRIHLTDQRHEHHVVPDRTRPLDYEVHSITQVTGHGGDGGSGEQPFLPLYTTFDAATRRSDLAYYTLNREPRVTSDRKRHSGYAGSEVFVTLVDAHEAPYRADLRQLSVAALCSNRDLPLQMPVGKGNTDFTLTSGAPVTAVRCLAGPTRPHAAWPEGEAAWRLVGNLSLNYLSLIDNDEEQGAAALRELLALYADVGESSTRKQIAGVRHIASKPVVRRIDVPGPIAFGRGLEITLTMDENQFEGTGVYLLGAVLDRFMARYASINAFTETVLRTTERGEIMRWPLRTGMRHVL